MHDTDSQTDGTEQKPVAYSGGERIVAKANGTVVEGDWETMKRLGKAILREAENHKTDLQKASEISGAHIRVSCDCCDWEGEFERARGVRDRGATPEEHADHPDFECQPEDVAVEAFCPRHGTIPLAYDECDGCADARNVMNR
jgi:hypothetical protein